MSTPVPPYPLRVSACLRPGMIALDTGPRRDDPRTAVTLIPLHEARALLSSLVLACLEAEAALPASERLNPKAFP